MIFYFSSNTFSGDQIKTNEMGRARSKYGGLEMCIQGCGAERHNFEDLGVDGKIILKWAFNKN
jgi:hypothetical protein